MSRRELFEVMVREVPLFDERGAFRPHVLCFVIETNTRRLESREVPLSANDRILILQGVSVG